MKKGVIPRELKRILHLQLQSVFQSAGRFSLLLLVTEPKGREEQNREKRIKPG